jgi:hypothetical protein
MTLHQTFLVSTLAVLSRSFYYYPKVFTKQCLKITVIVIDVMVYQGASSLDPLKHL